MASKILLLGAMVMMLVAINSAKRINIRRRRATDDDALCGGCKMSNGIGYNNHPTDCQKYIQCDFSTEGSVKANEMQCPLGLFWDQNGLTCNYPGIVSCVNDPCKNVGTLFYKISTNCRMYHSCEKRLTAPACCAPNYSFSVVNNQCEPDARCTELCPGEEAEDEPTCNKRSIVGKLSSYEENIPGRGWTERSCAPYTGYRHADCECTIDLVVAGAIPVQPACTPIVRLTFDDGQVRDVSGKYNWVQNIAVNVNDGSGYFGVASGLRLPRFSNAPLGPKFMIKMRYRTDGAVTNRQALVTNRDCGKPGSLAILLDQTTTTFRMRTEDGNTTDIPITVASQSEWRDITYRFDNDVFSGEVDGNTLQKTNIGMIGKSECALQIGRGNTYSNFKGYIDYFEVYNC
ncbi:protein PIF [Patella vulgata]|uniref:protein PIF n=1 Tax=Patella vulgata TaxID=6465 RepID=UPI00218075F9|nr:protein PIF [Patella vulgata]